MGQKAEGYRQNRGKTSDGNPNPIDKYVGARIRQRRLALGWSQEKLAKCLKLSFQQLQKYENGSNRVGASRLYDFATVLGVSANYFFDNISEELGQMSPRHQFDGADSIPEADMCYLDSVSEGIYFLRKDKNWDEFCRAVRFLYSLCCVTENVPIRHNN